MNAHACLCVCVCVAVGLSINPAGQRKQMLSEAPGLHKTKRIKLKPHPARRLLLNNSHTHKNRKQVILLNSCVSSVIREVAKVHYKLILKSVTFIEPFNHTTDNEQLRRLGKEISCLLTICQFSHIQTASSNFIKMGPAFWLKHPINVSFGGVNSLSV